MHLPAAFATRAFACAALLVACASAGSAAGRTALGGRATAAASPRLAGWSQSFLDAAHTGYNTKERLLSNHNVSGLQLLWAQSVSGGVTGFAIDHGVLFAQGQGASQGPVLVALSAATGAPAWSVTTGNDGYFLNGTVATGNGLVFVGCSADLTNQQQGICAYKESSGKRVWSSFSDCNCLPPAAVSAPLVYDSGAVYFGYSSGGVNQTHGIYAIDARNSGSLWGYGEFNNNFSVGPPAAGGGLVYFAAGASPYAIEALDAASGNAVWSFPVDTTNAEVSVSAGVVYASLGYNGSNATLIALNASTGATLWSFPYASSFVGGGLDPQPVAIAKGVVYLSGVDGNLYALRARSGRLLWSAGLTGYNKVTSAPSVANGVVYVNGGNYNGGEPNTTAYDAASGTLLWASPSNHGTLNMPPEVANGILYFASPGDSICMSICAYSVPAEAARGRR